MSAAPPPELRVATALALAYRGGDVAHVDQDTVCFLTGSALTLHNTKTDEMRFAWGPDSAGITAFAVHARFGLVAYATAGAAPAIHVLAYPRMEVLVTLTEPLAAMGFGSMCFSRDGSRLAALGTAPEAMLLVWEWETQTQLAVAHPDPRSGVPTRLSFNPLDPNALCTLGPDGLCFWRIEKHLDQSSIAMTPSGEVFSQEGDPLRIADHPLLAHCWSPQGYVYVGTASGALLRFDPDSGNAAAVDMQVERADGGVRALLPVRDCVVTGGADGVLRWFDLASHQVTHISRLPVPLWLREAEREDGLERAPAVVHVAPSPDYRSLLVATASGDLVALPMPSLDAHASLSQAGPSLDLASAPSQDLASPESPPGARTLLSSHTSPVLSLSCFPEQHLVATADISGVLRIWNYVSHVCLSTTQVPGQAPLSAVACHPMATLLATGSAFGVLRLYDVTMPETPRLVHRVKLYANAPIDRLAWSPDGDFLAASATLSGEGRLFLIDVSAGAPEVVGYWPCDGALTDLAWCDTPDDAHGAGGAAAPRVLCATASGRLWRLSAAHAHTVPTDNLCVRSRDALGAALVYPDFPVCALAPARAPAAAAAAPGGTRLFALSHDRACRTYTVAAHVPDPGTLQNGTITPADSEHPGHAKSGGRIRCSPDGRWVASGGADGALVVRDARNPSSLLRLARHAAGVGGVVDIAWSFDGQYLFSCGCDGGVFGYLVSYPEWTVSEQQEAAVSDATAALMTIDDARDDDPSVPDIVTAAATSAADALRGVHERVTAKRTERLEALRMRFQEILDHNQTLPEIEQLERDEFVVDPGRRNSVLAVGRQAARNAKEELRFANLSRDALWARIKSDMWDAMVEPVMRISGFESPLTVESYAIRRRSPHEDRLLRKLKMLRRVEEDEFASRRRDAERAVAEAEAAAQVRRDSPRSVSLQMSHPQRRRRASVVLRSPPMSSLGRKREDSPLSSVGSISEMGSMLDLESECSHGGAGSSADGDTGSGEQDLLYDPFSVSTRQRQITQMELLRMHIHHSKRRFNHEFRQVLDTKMAEIRQIEERNERIVAILTELDQSTDGVKTPTLSAWESPHQILTVTDAEMQITRFIPPAERERLRKQQEEEAERLRLEKGDDSGERALEMMMHGSPDDAVADALGVELVRPEWMDKPTNEMSEDEVKQLRAFEKQEQALQEEREKYRRALETELKNLWTQHTEHCGRFNDTLRDLFNLRLSTDMAICEDELKMVRYAQALLREEEDEAQEQQYHAQLEALKGEAALAAQQLTAQETRTAEVREEFEALRYEDARIDREFRAFISQDEFHKKTLYELFRMRHRKEHRTQPVAPHPQAPDGTRPIDPFAARDNTLLPQTQVADRLRTEDQPDDVPTDVWERVIASREAKIASERAVKQAGHRLSEMKRYLGMLREKHEMLSRELDTQVAALSEFRATRKRNAMNIEIHLTVKQGQEEVGEYALLYDNTDNILVDRALIEKHNARIRRLGDEKMRRLEAIQHVRQRIAQVEWENRRLDMHCAEISDEIRDFQMLRVTKQLQELIKGGAQDRRGAEVANLERRLAHAASAHDTKIADRRRELAVLTKQISMRHAENKRLDAEIEAMEQSVAERLGIHKIQSQRAPENAPQQRMAIVKKRRRLVGLAKQQADEIARLTDQVERIRKATFPSFPAPRH